MHSITLSAIGLIILVAFAARLEHSQQHSHHQRNASGIAESSSLWTTVLGHHYYSSFGMSPLRVMRHPVWTTPTASNIAGSRRPGGTWRIVGLIGSQHLIQPPILNLAHPSKVLQEDLSAVPTVNFSRRMPNNRNNVAEDLRRSNPWG